MEEAVSAAFAVVALLYSAVGQAGGTGYVAVMGLLEFPPEIIKATALSLNILVAAIGCVQFYRAGLLTWRSCYPFGVLGVPFSFLGGATNLPAALYVPVVGGLLLLAGLQMVRSAMSTQHHDYLASSNPPFVASLIVGGAVGFGSGITGVGGGIFLAPLILMLHWTDTRQATGISASFNLLNSAAALAGIWATVGQMPRELPLWLLAVGSGALVGTWLGSRYLKPSALRSLLAVLLLAAGGRMVLSTAV